MKLEDLLTEKPAEAEPEEESDDEVGLDAATDEVMDALKSGDRDAFKAALKSFVAMC